MGFLFCALSAALIGRGLAAEAPAAKIVYWFCSVSCAALGLGYLLKRPDILLKRADGRLSPLSLVLFAPYHLFNHVFLEAFRRGSRKPRWTEIVPGLFLGGRLRPWDAAQFPRRDPLSVLDATAEFAEVSWLRSAGAYLSLPVLDTTAPTPDQLRRGLDFIRERLALGPVYVHCAFGHSRSATLVVAHLVASGQSQSVDEAIAFVKSKRPRVRPSPPQLAALQRAFPTPPITP